ncbi:MAG: repair protein RecO protein [Candidatus Moranbacteria bacterium GW2011_GWE2_35_2-]|nr:MAG: repair protein RecO protein [Candidatus Moranbacteria bacterium GW2011_GWE2_35_2-]KKQ22472.1 MAG: repair protein RecO protein [Candidatus Moranbacteria bacterium GW2011_GWF2_37_11]KKQ29541.1 MAG: repair protein RecO protein [Candidatus Moranbacteria bacterium GW2011_GWD1_37_17]KKQ30589.1 MAG: repair protein RecO protein [Candidatus Moranbacteria bacterium GW2011_GWE1_37_24]KKQ48187.1 MAG: repair protein RecO protein [Candidatus Moranbacteria bacterium GW2011_GWD2_37_9]HBO17168.1 DNA re
MEYKYTGIILGKYDVGETDRIYVIYTLEQGKIRALAKGVRKMHAKLSGSLESFNLVDILIARNRGMGKIKSAIVERNFSVIKNNFELLEKVFQVIGIFGRLMEDEQKDEEAFFLLAQYLKMMNEKNGDDFLRFRIITQGFLHQLFSLLGYQLEISGCAVCREKIKAGGNFFSMSCGGVVCHKCGNDVVEKMRVTDNTIKAMRIFSSNNLKSLLKLKIKKEEITELERVSDLFYRWIV